MAKTEKTAPPPIEEEAPPIEKGSMPMATAPKNGRWVELMAAGGKAWIKARWYTTRVRAAGSVSWVKAECWSTSDPPKLANRIDNPVAWRYPVS